MYIYIYIIHGFPRLANIHYANDIFLYVKSLPKLSSMTERIMNSLRDDDLTLTLNIKKTKLLRCNLFINNSILDSQIIRESIER